MTKSDALMSIELYKTFSTETQSVTEFLNTARPYEGALEMKLPPLNHVRYIAYYYVYFYNDAFTNRHLPHLLIH